MARSGSPLCTSRKRKEQEELVNQSEGGRELDSVEPTYSLAQRFPRLWDRKAHVCQHPNLLRARFRASAAFLSLGNGVIDIYAYTQGVRMRPGCTE